MNQCLLRRDPPRRIKRQTLLQQIHKRHQQLILVVLELDRRRRHEPRTQIPGGLRYVHFADDILCRAVSTTSFGTAQETETHASRYAIELDAIEPAHFVKV
jgi:hypothetical protein